MSTVRLLAARRPAARPALATALLLAALAAPAAAQGRPAADERAAPRLLAAVDAPPGDGAAAEVARPAAARLELVGAPDTLRLADLARGHTLLIQLVDAEGRAVRAPVRWRVVAGDVSLAITEPRTGADGFAQATLGRAPWLFARPGVATVEVSASGPVGATARHTIVLVR